MRRQRHDLFYCTAPTGARYLRWQQATDGTLRIPPAPTPRSRNKRLDDTFGEEDDDASDALVEIVHQVSNSAMSDLRQTTSLVAVVASGHSSGYARGLANAMASGMGRTAGSKERGETKDTATVGDAKQQQMAKQALGAFTGGSTALSLVAALSAKKAAQKWANRAPVDALPPGALVVVASGSLPPLDPASKGKRNVRLAGDSEHWVDGSCLEPVQCSAQEIAAAYLAALPRGRKAAFGTVVPFCVGKLQFQQAMIVAKLAGIRVRYHPLEFELRCAQAAALWNPTRSGAWLEDAVGRASAAGIAYEEICGKLNVEVNQIHCTERLETLPNGGPCAGSDAALKVAEHHASMTEILKQVVKVGNAQGMAMLYTIACARCGRLCGSWSCSHIGFCSNLHLQKTQAEAKEIYEELGSLELPERKRWSILEPRSPKKVSTSEEEEGEREPEDELTPAMRHRNLSVLCANLKEFGHDFVMEVVLPYLPPMDKIVIDVAEALGKVEEEYNVAWKQIGEKDRRSVEAIAFTKRPSKPVQQPRHVLELFREAWVRLPGLYLFAVQLMRLFGLKPNVTCDVKKVNRTLKKVYEDDPVAFAMRDIKAVRDLLRCSCVFDSLPVLAAAAELITTDLSASMSGMRRRKTLERLGLPEDVVDLGFRFEFGKNRFSDPAIGGYRDMLLYLNIDGHIAELQLQLSTFNEIHMQQGAVLFRWASLVDSSEIFYVGEADEQETGKMVYAGYGGIRDIDGSIYLGEWHASKFDGHGTQWLTSGDIYQGEFDNGLRNGRGICWSMDGVVYDGLWHDGENMQHGTFWYAIDGKCEVRSKDTSMSACFSKCRTKATLKGGGYAGRSDEEAAPVPVHEAYKALNLKDFPPVDPPQLGDVKIPAAFGGGILIEQRMRPGQEPFLNKQMSADEVRTALKHLIGSMPNL